MTLNPLLVPPLPLPQASLHLHVSSVQSDELLHSKHSHPPRLQSDLRCSQVNSRTRSTAGQLHKILLAPCQLCFLADICSSYSH